MLSLGGRFAIAGGSLWMIDSAGVVASGSPHALGLVNGLVFPGPSGELVGVSIAAGSALRVARIDQVAAPIGAPVRANAFPAGAASAPCTGDGTAHLLYTGDVFAMAWCDNRDGSPQVYVNTIRCAY